MIGQHARRYVVALAGIIAFSVLMTIRDEAHGVLVRALIAGLAGLAGSSAFFYVQRSAGERRAGRP